MKKQVKTKTTFRAIIRSVLPNHPGEPKQFEMQLQSTGRFNGKSLMQLMGKVVKFTAEG